MDITPFKIDYWNGYTLSTAEVKPCCREDNVVDYAIYRNGQLSFNITKSKGDKENWVISLKNADESINDDIIQKIGSAIDQHIRNKTTAWK